RPPDLSYDSFNAMPAGNRNKYRIVLRRVRSFDLWPRMHECEPVSVGSKMNPLTFLMTLLPKKKYAKFPIVVSRSTRVTKTSASNPLRCRKVCRLFLFHQKK